MQSVRQIARLNDLELQKCVPPNASWHTDYRDTAYIHIGGLPFELSEGDVLTIFSQYGNPVHLHLARDKETGKSRGFAFLKYEDQKSCDLAVDNLSGAGVLGRVLGVDHCRYQLKEGEIEGEGMQEDLDGDAGDETDREGDERRKRRRKSESESEEEEGRRPLLKEEAELAKLLREHDEDDPMKNFLVQEKKDEVAEALKQLELSKKDGKGHDRGERKRRHHRSRRHDSDEENEDKRREKHRSRRDREKDDGKEDKHRSRRDEEGDERSGKHRSRRAMDDGDRKDDRRRAHRDPHSEDEHIRRRDDRKHRRDGSVDKKSGRRDDSRERQRNRRD